MLLYLSFKHSFLVHVFVFGYCSRHIVKKTSVTQRLLTLALLLLLGPVSQHVVTLHSALVLGDPELVLLLEESAVRLVALERLGTQLAHLFALLARELGKLEPRLSLKNECGRVDLESLKEGCWAVLVDIAQVRVAVAADDALDGLLVFERRVLEGIAIVRSRQVVTLEVDGVNDVVPEGRVAALVLELVIRHEEALRAANAFVHADVLRPPMVASEGALVPAALRNVVLKRSQLVADSILPLLEMSCAPRKERVHVGPLAKLAPDSGRVLRLRLRHILSHAQQLMNNRAVLAHLDHVNLVDLRLDFAEQFRRLA